MTPPNGGMPRPSFRCSFRFFSCAPAALHTHPSRELLGGVQVHARPRSRPLSRTAPDILCVCFQFDGSLPAPFRHPSATSLPSCRARCDYAAGSCAHCACSARDAPACTSPLPEHCASLLPRPSALPRQHFVCCVLLRVSAPCCPSVFDRHANCHITPNLIAAPCLVTNQQRALPGWVHGARQRERGASGSRQDTRANAMSFVLRCEWMSAAHGHAMPCRACSACHTADTRQRGGRNTCLPACLPIAASVAAQLRRLSQSSTPCLPSSPRSRGAYHSCRRLACRQRCAAALLITADGACHSCRRLACRHRRAAALPYTIRRGTTSRSASAGSAKFTPLLRADALLE